MTPGRKRIILAVTATTLSLSSAMLWFLGSVVVVDGTGDILSAAITDSSLAKQPLHRLPGGIFFAIPRVEGAISLRCHDDSLEQRGYVTPHLHSWLHVRPGTGCSRVVQLR